MSAAASAAPVSSEAPLLPPLVLQGAAQPMQAEPAVESAMEATAAVEDVPDAPVFSAAAASVASASAAPLPYTAASLAAATAALPASLLNHPHKLPSSLPKWQPLSAAQKEKMAKAAAAARAATAAGAASSSASSGSKAGGPARVARQTQLTLPRRAPTPMPQTAATHAAQQQTRAQHAQQPQQPHGVAAVAGSKRARALQPSKPIAVAQSSSSSISSQSASSVDEIEDDDDVQVVEPQRKQPRYTREPLPMQALQQPQPPQPPRMQPPMLGPLPLHFGPSAPPPPPVQWQPQPPAWLPAAAYGPSTVVHQHVHQLHLSGPLSAEAQMEMQRIMQRQEQQHHSAFTQMPFEQIQLMQLQSQTAMTQRVYGPHEAAYGRAPQMVAEAAAASSCALYTVPSQPFAQQQQQQQQQHQQQHRQQQRPAVPIPSFSQLPPPPLSGVRPSAAQPFSTSASAIAAAPQQLVVTRTLHHCQCASPATPDPPRHMLQPHFVMKERLLTVSNPQWNDWRGEGLGMQTWEIDDTMATVEEKTRRALPSETRIALFGAESEMDLREKVNFSHVGVGFAHQHQQAIVYKNSRRGSNVETMPPPPPKHHLSRNAQQAIGAAEQKVERHSLTQYTFTGPVMLNPRTLPEYTTNYSRYLLCVLHKELKVTDLVRLLTFIETDLHSLFPHTLMTYALLFLQRISSALWLQRERSVAQRHRVGAPAEIEADAARFSGTRYHMQASKDLLSAEDVQWIQTALRALKRAYQTQLHVLLLACVMVGVKMLDDWPRGQKIYLEVYPGAISLRDWNLLERAILIVLDFNLWVTPEAFERKSDTQSAIEEASQPEAATNLLIDCVCVFHSC